ncbi:MAG TPA: tetratricopeptide repeat protein [Bacteroidia bacterium]|nr:tetratricopeptide repeat protein [Bacteroidia bacterium]
MKAQIKKSKLIVGLFLVASSTMIAQTLNDALKLTTNEQFESADAAYKLLIQSQPNSGDYYFYYGENYFKNDNMEMANTMYQKGADVNPTNPLPYVGLGKVQWYKGQTAEAKANFFKATTLGAEKNATVFMKIAEAYIAAPTKNLTDAFTLLAKATKLEPKNPEVYILTGDAFLEQNNGTKAVENYEKAGALDPKSSRALLKQGQVWNRAKNYQLAIDTYKKAKLIDSSFAPAYRELAEIYHRAGQDRVASAQYKKYLQLNDDCGARARYAGFLLEAKQYKEAVEASKEAQKCDQNNFYLNRYLAYSQYETADYPAGLENSNVFFTKAPADKVIPLDYEYSAKLLSKTGKDSLAIIDFKKALELQPEKIEINGDIASSYIKMKKYPEAIGAYKVKMEKGKPNANDYFGLMRAYYFSKDFINADSAAAQITKAQPELPLGYLWRGKINVQVDVNNAKWLAKPFYEMYLTKIKPEDAEKNKKDLIDVYNYLAAHYAEKKDCPNVKLYMQKVLELDPANAQAKKVLAGLKC